MNQRITRFLLDGDRVQENLTLGENEIPDNAVIEVFSEMLGGKGPGSPAIRQMLDEYDSVTDDEHEPGELNLSSDQHDAQQQWYEDLKCKFESGELRLDKTRDQDQKLCFLLETKNLQPYELIRLRNVYSHWEQLNVWREDTKNLRDMPRKEKEGNSKDSFLKDLGSKRNFSEQSHGCTKLDEEATPNKRNKLLATFGIRTPSPLIKASPITEIEMKRASVSIHLWAERKMGGVKFLQSTRLNDHHFEDILLFTGSGSRWKLMKDRTVKQLKSLWRNTFGGKHYYRGHKKTGFENEFQRHVSSEQFCPFGHCNSGVMSSMDIDLIVLTPKKNSSLASEIGKTISSRKLFEENEELNEPQNHDTVLHADQKKEFGMTEEFDPINDEWDNESHHNESKNVERNVNENEPIHNSCLEDNESKVDSQEQIFFCKICERAFQTFYGLDRHNSDKHSEENVAKAQSTCKICDKKVIYLDQHIKSVHSEVQKPTVCEICLKEINSNILRHRKVCIKCRYCNYTNLKKARLLNHIQKCDKKPLDEKSQDEPMDLRSPMKRLGDDLDEIEAVQKETNTSRREAHLMKTLEQGINIESNQGMDDSRSRGEDIGRPTEKHQAKVIHEQEDDLEKGRIKFPFDEESTDEDYYSEIDVDDADMFTIQRRKMKDDMEHQLREADALENTEIEGDAFIVEKFSQFMRNKRFKESKEEGYSKQTEPSTINLYSDVVRKDILRAFHKLVTPFDARWLIDCSTPKECLFEGEKRLHVNPMEPIYMTSRILQEALTSTRTQKKRVIASFNQLMDFIELNFTLKLNAYGPEVLNRVVTYHKGVKSYIKATSQWKKSKEEENEIYENNKRIKDYQTPNKDAEVLQKYKEYIKSEERLSKINKLLSYAYPGAEIPSPAVMTEFGITVMEEIISCTGCRPKVVRHLNMGAIIDAKPGFNPHNISGEDATVEEDIDGEQIWRRTSPNLPPKDKACVHQLRDKSANCSENCEHQCAPEGYNFWVTWDKTQSTKGPYFLHIPTPIKKLMDRYDIIRSKFFKEKTPKFGSDESWLEDDETPFFLNSSCNSFPSLDLKKLSILFGIDVTAYSFRRIVTTWALSHKSEEIRAAEEESLQHSLHVAKDRYMQNKQIKPQTLVQRYAKEENLFPQKFKESFQKDKSDIDLIIEQKQETRTKRRFSKLCSQQDLSKKLKFENRPLGPRNPILESDRRDFAATFEDLTGNKLENILVSLKPIQWRDYIVRVLCSAEGENGVKLRRLWIKLYEGDLLFGVRDERRKAKALNWPLRTNNPTRKDRSSWIAQALRKSCLAAQRFENKNK